MDFSNFTLQEYLPINSSWSRQDYLGALQTRMAIGRNSYKVNPGLYRFGNPGKESDVIVTANYKLSFDIVRRHLNGLNVWVLVLDTKGVNVWCAAGKGTFGTQELIRQIEKTRLNLNVSHRRLLLPQLGAPGIAAHEVKKSTGFNVKYGPIKAEDIKAYINAGYKKTDEMRTISFSFKDRLILTPVEIVNSLRYLLYTFLVVIALSGLSDGSYTFGHIQQYGLVSVLIVLTAYISGAFLGPVLLPFLPSKYFGGKGLVIGIITYIPFLLVDGFFDSTISVAAWLLLSVAISSFLTMNFTGASTYTSLSGVMKEMKFFVPLQILFLIAGLLLLILSKIF